MVRGKNRIFSPTRWWWIVKPLNFHKTNSHSVEIVNQLWPLLVQSCPNHVFNLVLSQHNLPTLWVAEKQSEIYGSIGIQMPLVGFELNIKSMVNYYSLTVHYFGLSVWMWDTSRGTWIPDFLESNQCGIRFASPWHVWVSFSSLQVWCSMIRIDIPVAKLWIVLNLAQKIANKT